MFPHRSDWTGYAPSSGWFFVAGAPARAFDALAVHSPVILQSRGVDVLHALRTAGWTPRTFGEAIERLAREPAAGTPEAWTTALQSDARSRTVSPESLRAILYAAWVRPRLSETPPIDVDAVTIPVDTILPSYGTDVFAVSYADPQTGLSQIPFRATWLGVPTAIAAGTRAGRALGGTVGTLFALPPFSLVGRVLGRSA